MTQITIAPDVASAFPALRIGVVICHGISNAGTKPLFESKLRAEEHRQKELLATKELPSLPEIKVWREAYKKFGSDPRDFRSSIEALLRRARAGNKPLPLINPLVDLYNYLSIKYHVPVGAEDLSKIKGDINLAFADGSERGLCLGSTEPEACDVGEVIYRDAESFICRRWNWREADRTKIDAQTTSAIVVIDTVGGIGEEILGQCLDELQQLIRSELGGTTQSAILDSTQSSLQF